MSDAFDGVTVAVKVYVSPSVIDRDVLSKLTPVTETVFAFTVTAQVAVLDPSVVVTVIVAIPGALAVTAPEEETVATPLLLVDQVTDWSAASDGEMVAIRRCVSPTSIFIVVLSRLTLSTCFLSTVTRHSPFLEPSTVIIVIVTVPGALALTSPEEDTVATESSLDDHITVFSDAFSGIKPAVSIVLSPSVNNSCEGVI